MNTIPTSPNETVPINLDRVRRVWHDDQWYFSVIDVIGELFECDHKTAKSYWSTFKARLKEDPSQDIVKQCLQIRLQTSNKKQMLTDVVNKATMYVLYANFLAFNLRRKKSRFYMNRDEVTQLHTLAGLSLLDAGFSIAHHFTLSSGSIVDYLARKSDELLMVECKISIKSRHNVYESISQVLCYCSEYKAEFGKKPTPYIATSQAPIDSYLENCCKNLGISILYV